MLGVLAAVRRYGVFSALIILLSISTISSAVLGWLVREVGRKPWTVYGLIKPEEVITQVPLTDSLMVFLYLLILLVNAAGLASLYVVATRPYKFVELLRRGAGRER
jgi:cytochrome d ubiquinol oxidase subunit I